jgi:hypothetical protein
MFNGLAAAACVVVVVSSTVVVVSSTVVVVSTGAGVTGVHAGWHCVTANAIVPRAMNDPNRFLYMFAPVCRPP